MLRNMGTPGKNGREQGPPLGDPRATKLVLSYEFLFLSNQAQTEFCNLSMMQEDQVVCCLATDGANIAGSIRLSKTGSHLYWPIPFIRRIMELVFTRKQIFSPR